MSGDKIMELIGMLAAFIPLFAFGVIMLIVGLKGRKKKDEPKQYRNPYVLKAKVVDMQVKEHRDELNYLRRREFFTTIEYEKNGEMKVNSFYHPYEYKTGSIIDVTVNQEGKVNILTPIPQGINSLNEKMSVVKGYKVALVAGVVSLILSMLMLCSALNVFMELSAIVMICLFFSPMFFFALHMYKKAKKRLHGMDNGYYKTYDATIVDVRKHVSRSNDSTKTTYYSIVEYVDNGMVKTTEFADFVSIDDIGKTRRIYVNEEENDLQTDETLKTIMFPTYLAIGAMSIFALVFLFAGI